MVNFFQVKYKANYHEAINCDNFHNHSAHLVFRGEVLTYYRRLLGFKEGRKPGQQFKVQHKLHVAPFPAPSGGGK